MNNRSDNRKFHRSPKSSSRQNSQKTSPCIMSPSIYATPMTNIYSNMQYQYSMQNQQTYKQLAQAIQVISNRLDMLEIKQLQSKIEKQQELIRITKMVRDMQCKHSSIIYNSQIKYLKPNLYTQPSLQIQRNQTIEDNQGNIKRFSYINPKSSSLMKRSSTSLRGSKVKIFMPQADTPQLNKLARHIKQKVQQKQPDNQVVENRRSQNPEANSMRINQNDRKQVTYTDVNMQALSKLVLDGLQTKIHKIVQKQLNKVNNMEPLSQLQCQIDQLQQWKISQQARILHTDARILQEHNKIQQIQRDTQQKVDSLSLRIAQLQQLKLQSQINTLYSKLIKFQQTAHSLQASRDLSTSNSKAKTKSINSSGSNNNDTQKQVEILKKTMSEQIINIWKEMQNIQNKSKNNISISTMKVLQKIRGCQNRTSNNLQSIQGIKQEMNGLKNTIKNLQTRFISHASQLIMSQQPNMNPKQHGINSNFSNEISQMAQSQQQMSKNVENIKLQIRNQKIKRQQQINGICAVIRSELAKRIEYVKDMHAQLINRNYQKLEDCIMGTIQRHIGYVQNFIRKVEQNQDTILNKYLPNISHNYGCGDVSNKPTAVDLQDVVFNSRRIDNKQNSQYVLNRIQVRFQQKYKILKQDVKILTDKNMKQQSTLARIIQGLKLINPGVALTI